MVVIKTTKDINQKGQKATLDQLNKNVEKLTKVLEDKQLPSTTNKKNTLVNKIEEERKKREEKRIRTEDRKLREQDLKEIKQAIKDTIPADTKRDILSTGIGSFTGINPVLVKTFGLDNLAKAIVNTAIDKVFTRTKSRREERLEAEAGNINSSSSISNKKQKSNDKLKQAAGGAAITDKTDSAVEQNKQQNNPTNKLLAGIFGWLKKWKQKDTKTKEEEKESWLKKLLKAGVLALALGGVIKALGGVGSVIKDIMDSVLINFFKNNLGLGTVGGVLGAAISDMLPGALLGAKFGGAHGALIGGVLSLAYFSIKRTVDDYERRTELAEEGIYSKAVSVCGIPANVYKGMVLGGIAGFMIAGPIGAIAGGFIGAGGGWIWDQVLDAKIRAKVNSTQADKALEGTNTKEEAAKKAATKTQASTDKILKQAGVGTFDIFDHKLTKGNTKEFRKNAIDFLSQRNPNVDWNKFNTLALQAQIEKINSAAKEINEKATDVLGPQWDEAQLDEDKDHLTDKEIKEWYINQTTMLGRWWDKHIFEGAHRSQRQAMLKAYKEHGPLTQTQAVIASMNSDAYKNSINTVLPSTSTISLQTDKIDPESEARDVRYKQQQLDAANGTKDELQTTNESLKSILDVLRGDNTQPWSPTMAMNLFGSTSSVSNTTNPNNSDVILK